ncbi:MAG: SDR family oxidoreductase [Sphingopyxis sp.]|nr:SDR family oxidoreductase [Sphingopyxis sp.]
MTNLSLTNRTALVTGASRGIGRGIALALAEAGANVAVNYTRDADAAAETVAMVRALGRRAEAYQASVTDEDACTAMVDAIARDFGGLSILINNAGIASRGRAVADTDPAELERVMAVHALGPHRLARLCLPLLRQHPRSDIIIISSVATLHHAPNGAPYNMGKAAGEALALTLAKEEMKHGVRVNIVAPALTVSDMGERLARAVTGEADIHHLDAKFPFGRVPLPSDVAAAVVWLVSDANPYCSGQKLNIDGAGLASFR